MSLGERGQADKLDTTSEGQYRPGQDSSSCPGLRPTCNALHSTSARWSVGLAATHLVRFSLPE